jgi:hypothetical protein
VGRGFLNIYPRPTVRSPQWELCFDSAECRIWLTSFRVSIVFEVTYVTVRIEPTLRFDCSGPRILRSCVLAHNSATSQPEFPKPHRLCFCRLLCPWRGRVFLGEDFRFGSKEETLVQTRLPVRSVANPYSGMRVVLGWGLYTGSDQSLDIRSPFYKILSFKARISERQQ